MARFRAMTQEDKQLLLQDLCGRLPYSPICHIIGENGTEIDDILTTSTIENLDVWVVKPYLRPMSSMTEEEKKSLPFPWVYNFGVITSYCESEGFIEIRDDECSCIIDWLNEHHFDYRGLIPKGLAISTEEFNLYKN